MMGQSRARSTKRYVERTYLDRVIRAWYECAACRTQVQMTDNYCRGCGLDIREVEKSDVR